MPIDTNSGPYWDAKPLSALTAEEWESLCDGCGKCCLVLIEDEDTGEVWETDVHCRLFDSTARRCRDYERRHAEVPGCVRLTPGSIEALRWMPETCAYRLRAEGRPLPEWHPLRTGDPGSTAKAGAATPTTLVCESAFDPDDIEDRITCRRCGPRGRSRG